MYQLAETNGCLQRRFAGHGLRQGQLFQFVRRTRGTARRGGDGRRHGAMRIIRRIRPEAPARRIVAEMLDLTRRTDRLGTDALVFDFSAPGDGRNKTSGSDSTRRPMRGAGSSIASMRSTAGPMKRPGIEASWCPSLDSTKAAPAVNAGRKEPGCFRSSSSDWCRGAGSPGC